MPGLAFAGHLYFRTFNPEFLAYLTGDYSQILLLGADPIFVRSELFGSFWLTVS